MGLQIHTTWAQIGINTKNASMTIEQPKGELSIQTTQPKLKIDRELPKVKIDQYQCFAEAGLKNYRDLTADFVQRAKQAALQGIARRVSEGDQLASIGKDMPLVIPDIAKRNAYPPQAEFNMVTMPKSRPKIEVTGHLNIDWGLGETNINYTPKKPVINYQPGKVEVYLKQKPDIQIRYINERR